MSTNKKQLTRHGQFSEHYTNEDRELVIYIENFLKQHGFSQADLAKASGVPQGTLSPVLGRKYPTPPTKHLQRMEDGIQRLLDRQSADGRLPVVETSVLRSVFTVCEEALKMRRVDAIGLFAAHVGVGKTTAFKEFCRRNPNALYVKGSQGMTKSELLLRLMDLLNINPVGKTTIGGMQGLVVRAVRNKERLIILDEANRVSRTVLELLRDISDETETALVFGGREFLA